MYTLKDPEEVKAVVFNFDGLADSLLNASVDVARYGGFDEPVSDVSLELDGDAVVDGVNVVQRVRGGTVGVTYMLTCRVDTASGDILVDRKRVLVALELSL